MTRRLQLINLRSVALNRKKVRELRKALRLTQTEAAERAGFANRHLWYQIESGARSNITLETLYKIAAALEIHPGDLLVDPKRKTKGK